RCRRSPVSHWRPLRERTRLPKRSREWLASRTSSIARFLSSRSRTILCTRSPMTFRSGVVLPEWDNNFRQVSDCPLGQSLLTTAGGGNNARADIKWVVEKIRHRAAPRVVRPENSEHEVVRGHAGSDFVVDPACLCDRVLEFQQRHRIRR